MNNVKSMLTGASALVLAGLILTMLVPKAAHAIAATLVQVENTTAQPVPNLDMNTPGEETFQVKLCTNLGGNPTCPTNGTTASVTVPSMTADGRQVRRLARISHSE